MRLYFDTNVVRYLSIAFSRRELPAKLREAIVLSPISTLELLSQLCDDTATQAFEAVQAMWNWVPARVALLDIPPVFIRLGIAGDDEDGPLAFERMTNALTISLHAKSPAELRDASKELRTYLQKTKLSDAETRQTTVLSLRQTLRREKRKALTKNELRDAFSASMAARAKVDPDHPGVARFVERLEAHYEHETARLQRAISMPKMNLVSKKRQNDLFDSEQLLYLSVPELCFVTTDQRGYDHLLGLDQGKRIRLTRPDVFLDGATAEQFIRDAVAGQP